MRCVGFILNFGPQHPAAHGVLRLIVELHGEIVVNIDTHIGLLHRGTEKLLEYKNLLQGLPYMDRLDYVSMMVQEQAYSLTIESIFGIKVAYKAQYIRVLFAELTRILNHLLAVTTHALDIGALTPFLWGFEEREKIMEFYERVSGARMHAAFIRPGGISNDISDNLLSDIELFLTQFIYRISDIESLLSSNLIWESRLRGVGFLNYGDVVDLGFSGVMVRGSGIQWDLRYNIPYDCYSLLNFHVPVGKYGDCFDRYLIRILEMKESVKICQQVLNFLRSHLFMESFNSLSILRNYFKFDMQSLINHFQAYTKSVEAFNLSMLGYCGVEAPKGEFGVFMEFTYGQVTRMRIKAPGFVHLQGLGFLAKNALLADLVASIGTLDIVFGEIDR